MITMLRTRTSIFPVDFPPECRTHALSFLSLRDVLKFQVLSSASLRETLPCLQAKRERMKRRFVYTRDWSRMGLSASQATLEADEAIEKFPGIGWTELPTVAERVRQLACQLPRSHPISRRALELRGNLEKSILDDEIHGKEATPFAMLLTSVKRLTKAQRLHAEILSSAMKSHPDPEQDNFCTSLDQYMGDVFCVTYLINQSHLGIVEGGPTNDSFVQNLRHLPHGSFCYRSWVYIHSCILRRKFFTPQQRQRLGIPDFNGLSEIVPADLYVKNHLMLSVLTLIYSDFGPLGPSFRGRDNVRMTDITYKTLFRFWVSSESQQPPASRQQVTELLMAFHERTRQARPMTVRPPIIRLSNYG